MKACITDGKGNVKLEDIDMVKVGPYQCLCKINACATCSGTDKKLVNGLFNWADKYPAILGHEGVGTVIECGSKVKNFKLGDKVLRPAVALPGTMYGNLASWMGNFAEYGLVTDIKAMENVPEATDPFGYTRYQQIIPKDVEISDCDATMLIMLKEVAGACKGAQIKVNHTVLVLGAGAVAQAMCFFASKTGANVIAAARRTDALANCLKCGAKEVINICDDNLITKILEITNNRGVDIIMDAAGDAAFAIKASNLLVDGGGIASYATVDGGFPFDQIKAKGTWKFLDSAVPENEMHEEVIQLIRTKELNPKDFYSHKMDFDDFEEGFNLLTQKQASKIVFEMK